MKNNHTTDLILHPAKHALALLALATTASAAFTGEFEKLDQSNPGEVIDFLERVYPEEIDNPEYYVMASNFWCSLGNRIVTTANVTEGDGTMRAETTDGEQITVAIKSYGSLHPEVYWNALGLLQEATRRFPHRADIWLGLAHLQRQRGLHEDCRETLVQFLELAAKDMKQFSWLKGEPFPVPAEEFIPLALHPHCNHYWLSEEPGHEEISHQLCTAVIKVVPGHPYAHNILGGIAFGHDDFEGASQHFATAADLDPSDAVVLTNLGHAFRMQGKLGAARIVYRDVLECDSATEDLLRQASDGLRLIEEELGDD